MAPMFGAYFSSLLSSQGPKNASTSREQITYLSSYVRRR